MRLQFLLLLVFLTTPVPASAQWDRPRTIEYNMMDVLYQYYRRQRVSPMQPPRELRCVGQTVWDCFRGDYVCIELRSCDRDEYLEERAGLITRLDSAAIDIAEALGLGGDLMWVEGQRVAFRLAERKFDEAEEVARACIAADWWCAALRGYIAHLQHDYEAAEREYRASVAVMPKDIRLRWTSLHPVYAFDGDYEKIADACKELPLTHPIWTLWDPLFTMPGNDRMTEHFARHTAVRLRNDALDAIEPGRMPFHDTELIQRGLWDSWMYVASPVQEQQRGRPERTSVRSNNTTRAYAIRPRWEHSGLRFLPSLDMAKAPFSTTSSDWRVSVDNGADQYRPAYGTVRSFDAVAAWLFREGTGVLLVQGKPDAPPRAGARWATVLWDGIEYHAFDVQQRDSVFTTIASLPLAGLVVSMEAILPDSGALRARLGSTPPALDTMRVSDLILVREDPGPAPSPDDVATLMLPVWEWRRSDGPLRLYWEYYLPPEVTSADLRLEVLQQAGGIWNAVTSVFGATPEMRSLSWTDELAPTREPFRGRSVAVDVGSLPSGNYRLALSVTAGDLPPVTIERAFRMR